MSAEVAMKEQPGYRLLCRVAWPLIVSTGSFSLLHFFDRLFLSWYSEDAFRAALPGGVLFFTLVCGFIALAAYTNTFVAQFHGADDPKGCGRAAGQGILFSLCIWPLMLALIPAGRWMLDSAGHEPSVLAAEKTYFSILMIGSVSAPFGAAVSGFFSGRGDTVTVMVCNLAGNLVNAVLDYGLVFGKFGLPELGIAGAAWATNIGSWVSPLLLLGLMLRRRTRRQYGTVAGLRPDVYLIRRMLRFGVPSGVHLALDVAAFTVFVMLTGRLDEASHVASNIALSVNFFAFMPMTGFGIAASILTGRFMGARDPGAAAKIGWMTWRVGLAYMALVAFTFAVFPDFYLRLFARGSALPDETAGLARLLLLYLAAWGAADATNLILAGALKGAGDTKFVMWFEVLIAWLLFVPGCLLLMGAAQKSLLLLWSWLLIYITVLAVGFLVRFRSGRWRNIDLLGEERRDEGSAV